MIILKIDIDFTWPTEFNLITRRVYPGLVVSLKHDLMDLDLSIKFYQTIKLDNQIFYDLPLVYWYFSQYDLQ